MPTTKSIDMFNQYKLSKKDADDIASLQCRGHNIMTGDFLISEYELYDLIEKYYTVKTTQEKIASGILPLPDSGEIKILTYKEELNAPTNNSMKGAYPLGRFHGNQFTRRFSKGLTNKESTEREESMNNTTPDINKINKLKEILCSLEKERKTSSMEDLKFNEMISSKD